MVTQRTEPPGEPGGAAVPDLEKWFTGIKTGNWNERAKAAQALAAAGPRAVNGLTNALASSKCEVRYVATWALGEIGGEEVISHLCNALHDSHWTVREVAARALGHIGNQRARGSLSETAQRDAVKSVRCAALEALQCLERHT
jgi:HEAT repeat protein